ncbi:MAG TPA: hypothetical protein VK797_14160 [Tepidisphaeraceae bacterium]|nr:hypothetical protein [Tepidisphaeraceae bacterium]
MPPTALLESLRTIGRKVRLYALAIGAEKFVTAIVGLLAAIVFIDWAAHFTGAAPGGLPGVARLTLELAALLTLAWWLVKWVVRPAFRRHSDHSVAGWVEERFPQFGDTLSSTVNFLSTEVPGSKAMKDRVVGQATEQLKAADLAAVIDPRPLWHAGLVACGSVIALIVLTIAVGPVFRQVAVSWLLHPLNGQAWPKTVQIAVDGHMPQRIAVGDQVPVRVRLARGDRAGRRVIVRYRYDEGAWQEQVMDRGPDGAYAASLDTRLDDGRSTSAMQIAIEAGDDDLALSPVTIVPRLDLASIEADITSPAYVHANGQQKVNLTERPAVMAYGSTVDVQLHFNKPLAPNAPVDIVPTNPSLKLAPIQWDRPDADLAVAHLPAEQSFRFTVHATDTDNFHNLGAAEYELIVREDTPPTVQIEEPRRSEDRTAVAAFPLKAVAEDDYGVEGAQLVVQRIATASSAPTTRPAQVRTSDGNKWMINLVDQNLPGGPGVSWRETGGSVERKRYELAYDWDLAALQSANLKPGDVLEYFVQVKDNFNLNGRQHDWVASGKLRITIISQEQLSTAVQTAFESIHTQLKELRQGQLRNKTETESLRQMTQRKPAFDEADKAQAERIAGQQSNAASQAMQIAQRLADLTRTIQQNKASDAGLQQTADSVQQQIQNTAEGPMKDAAQNINDARDQKAQPRTSSQSGQNQQQNSSRSSQSQQQNGQQQNGQQEFGQQQRGQQQGGQQQNGQLQNGQQQNGQQQNGQQQSGQQQSGQQQSGQQQSGQQQSGQQKQGQSQQNQQNAQPDEQKLSDEPMPEEAKPRDAAMARAAGNQQKAADQIQTAMDRLGNFDGLTEFRQKLEAIKEQQQKLGQEFNKAGQGQLGKKPEDLSQQKRDEMQKLSDQQKELARQTQNALDQMNRKAEQTQRSDPNSSQAMRAAAQAGNDQQVPGKQSQAAQSMQQNQQADAQAAQQQAELGLQIVISKLAEAERRKLEELQAKLAELRDLMDDLVRRQAGHNLDNLLLQGGDTLKKMDVADRQSLFDNSARDPKQPQDARTIRDLDTSQRVTERNTRDVAKKAEQLPDPAPAAKLTVAAGHMERAIVHLNNEKLPDAYDPPQVDALASLLDARNLVDKALDKIQEQLNQQKKESIRQAYVKLLEDQKKIGGDVRTIDGKQKDGALPRPDAIRLGQLPGDQGGLADRAGDLGKRLQELDSIVYVWANSDIVKTMNEVKDDLAKPETGVATQAEETRIEDQLQAMIDSLKVKPRQREFNERQARNQGGQSGQPKVRMPGEAELQLLKALQLAVNKSTKTIDDQKDKDKEKLLALGGRQGDMRGLLDKMIQRATQGKLKLGPEPDNRDQLPEEAKKGDVEDQELENQLLNQKLSDDESENTIKLTGDRMARSRQRLAVNNDPGKITQEIQKRIVIDLDSLIEQARNQQAQMRPGQRQPGKQGQQPQPGQGNRGQQQIADAQHREQGQNAAQQSVLAPGGQPQVDISQQIKQEQSEWAKLHPRDRVAIVEGGQENVNPKYQKLVDDYYKTLNQKATEQQR